MCPGSFCLFAMTAEGFAARYSLHRQHRARHTPGKGKRQKGADYLSFPGFTRVRFMYLGLRMKI